MLLYELIKNIAVFNEEFKVPCRETYFLTSEWGYWRSPERLPPVPDSTNRCASSYRCVGFRLDLQNIQKFKN